jgi:cytochrome oxidase Cu insertion factor (SCO1/SenC/PrrC family)
MAAGCLVFPISVYFMTRNDATGEAPPGGRAVTELSPSRSIHLGGPFTLTSSRTKQSVTDADVFLGKWTLLYFGFTKCAEVCPNTLRFIADLMQASDQRYVRDAALGDDAVSAASQLQACFLSIDYIRDTPDAVDAFVTKYDPNRIVGLCGDREHVEQAARAWRVYFSSYDETEEEKTAREQKGIDLPQISDAYQFDHSSAIYLVGPDGKMKDFFFREIGIPVTLERLGLHFQDVYGIN